MEEEDDGLLMDSDSWDISYLYRVLVFQKIDGQPISQVKRQYKSKTAWKLDAKHSHKTSDKAFVTRIDDNEVKQTMTEPKETQNSTNLEASLPQNGEKKLTAMEKAKILLAKKKLKAENK